MKPAIYDWDGESMIPVQRFRQLADKQFVVGEKYQLVVQEDRSAASHRQYFASVHEAWTQLPEDIAENFPTDEHLRKWALCRAGYADERSFVCSSKAEALRLVAFLKPMDQFAIIVSNECTVKVFTPQSQSMRAMGKKAFQDSKQKVLDIVWALVGTTPEAAAPHVGKAA